MSCLLCCFKTFSLFGFRDCIMNTTAFRPPEQRRYELKPDRHDMVKGPLYKMIVKEVNGSVHEAEDLEGLESCVIWLDTKTNKQIPALFIENKNCRSGFVILYSHGNSTDLGRMFKQLQELAQALNVHLLAYEYSGYGPTKGNVGEYEVMFGITAAYEFLIHRLGFKWNNIILYGRSIGSGPTVYLASNPKYPVGGVILHSPIASGLRVFKFDMQKTDSQDLFPNCDYIEHVKAHVFIIHGEADSEVSVAHGKLLATKCKNLYSPWWVSNGTHNDIDYNHRKSYFIRVAKFLKYVRDFNIDKSTNELEEIYRVTPWWHTSKHIYIKKAQKIEEDYKHYMVKNGKKAVKDVSWISGGSLSSQRGLKDNILRDPKEGEQKVLEEYKRMEEPESRNKERAYFPPRISSKSFSVRPKQKAVEIEFNSYSSRGKDVELEEDRRSSLPKEGRLTSENLLANENTNLTDQEHKKKTTATIEGIYRQDSL